jgi:hypothetical protein
MKSWWNKHIHKTCEHPAQCFDCNAGDCGGCATVNRPYRRSTNSIIEYKGDRLCVNYYVDPTGSKCDVKSIYVVGRKKPDPAMIKLENRDIINGVRDYIETNILPVDAPY